MRWIVRIAWAVAGVIWLLWIGYEDREQSAVTAVAALVAGAFGLSGFARWVGPDEITRRTWLVRTALAGTAAGASVGPLAALFMILKLGLHTHVVPHFDVADLMTVLGRTPVWTAIGLLAGLAGGLLGLALERA
jgi:hypothetical protein